jgi:WD40-like Beta Propeller Repeat
MERRLRVTLTLALLVLASLLPSASPPALAATIPGTIAYVSSQTGNGTDIRLIEPDGTNDRRIFTVPDSPISQVSTLAWRPDAAELAFASAHAAATSLYEKDIYAIRPDGRGLRKLTNGPSQHQLAGYPTGNVTIDVFVGASGPALVYLAGAAEPQTVLSSARLTFTGVADFGPGVIQGAVGIVGARRWYSAAADVQAGQTVHAGSLQIIGAGTPRRADRPSWRSDGTTIGFMVGESCGEFRQLSANPPINALGETLLAPSSTLGFLCAAEWGPTPALADQLLYNEWDSTTRGIYRTTAGSAKPGELLVEYDVFHLLLDLKWLPDGTGFIIAVAEWRAGRWASSNLYEHSFATKQLRQITSFDAELAGAFSISPDGQWIAFERAPNLEAFADLWLVRRDGSDMRLLATKAARPAWSSRVPQAAPEFHVYLPAAMR